MRFKLKRNLSSGFTLLEVIIALTIMTIAFGAILASQSGSIHHTIKSKEMNIAGWLANRVMVESEHLLEKKPFSELAKETTEKFPEPYERFTWKREIKEITLPDFSQPPKEGEAVAEATRILAKVMTKYLSSAIREMIITIKWQRETTEQSLSISTYLIDLNAEFNFAI